MRDYNANRLRFEGFPRNGKEFRQSQSGYPLLSSELRSPCPARSGYSDRLDQLTGPRQPYVRAMPASRAISGALAAMASLSPQLGGCRADKLASKRHGAGRQQFDG